MSKLRDTIGRITIQRAVTLFLAFLLVLFLILNWLPDSRREWLARYQGGAYDTVVAALGDSRLDPRIVIVDVDERSLAEVGRWPWDRDIVARLLAGIQAGNPQVIGLDILFPEPADPRHDRQLAGELARNNVVSAVAFGMAGETGQGADNRPPETDPRWPLADRKVGLAQSLREPESGNVEGHITPLYDNDFVIRRISPVICHHSCTPVLSFAMLQVLAKRPLELRATDSPAPAELCVGHACLVLNPDNSLLIPYQNSSRFRFVSAVEILDADRPPPELDGAMVLVGTSAVGLGDRVSTPISVNTPGVLIHAVMLAAAMDNYRWAVLPGFRQILSVGFIVVGLLAFLWRYTATRGKIAIVGLWCLIGVSPLLLPYLGYWLPPGLLWVNIFFCAVAVGVSDFWLARFQRKRIYDAFTAYVPSVVLEKLVSDNMSPEQLDAQRAEITVLFADIRGFTALSERLEPEQLVEITGQLFTEITEEIHRHKGTLDKYMGDAVMAFWGAPLPQADHPRLAADCALAIRHRVERLESWLAARGYPKISMTLGLECGTATVGNLGSRQRRAYTVMGKTVNLAAHLQRQCDELGSEILFGPELSRRLPPTSLVFMDGIRIRGIGGTHRVSRPAEGL